MKWLHSARTRLHLLFDRRAAESRMDDEFLFHLEMETEQLRAKGRSPEEARRQALAAFGGVEKHKEALRDGRGLAWLGGLSLDVKLGVRMLRKYPSLSLGGGLALAIAIGVGAGYHDLMGSLFSPVIPLPEGDRLVLIETQNTRTNVLEPRLARDFLEWRRELRTVEDLGAYRGDTRSLIAGDAAPEPIQVAELTAAAFRAARVSPLRGRALLDSDELAGAPRVVVLAHHVWQRTLGGRQDVLGSVVKLGSTPATVIGIMPEGFGYPFNHDAWTPLSLRASYEPLEGGMIAVVGRLAPGVTLEQAAAELNVAAERTAAALPATHAHLRPRVMRLGQSPEEPADIARFALMNLPVLLVLSIACMTVGTLVYARTATREGEIALRSALGASRARIVGQLFVEALVLASVAAAVGLVAADRVLTWGVESAMAAEGGAPFWMTPGLKLRTILYAAALAVVSAVLLSVLPALRATRARIQSHLANGGTGGATLRFGRVWTGAMIVQVALTAIGIPAAIETAVEEMRTVNLRAAFPVREHLTARVAVDPLFEEEEQTVSALQERQAQTFAALERRLAQEPDVVAITFADSAPGSASSERRAEVESAPGVKPALEAGFRTSTVGPGFFETFDRPIVAGRAFNGGDRSPGARTVIVNEAFARWFSRETGRGSPIGARLRYAAPSRNDYVEDDEVAKGTARPRTSGPERGQWFEIVGVVRNFDLDPDDYGRDKTQVFHAGTAGTVSPLMMSVRMRGNPAPLAARLPSIAVSADARLFVQEAESFDEWLRQRNMNAMITAGAWAAVTGLVLFLSSMGIFSLMSVSVSRRTREIGLRAALGAHPRQLLAGILSHALVLMGSGLIAGGALLLFIVWMRVAEDVVLYAGYLGVTSAVMVAACLLACIGPARRALKINPTDALKQA